MACQQAVVLNRIAQVLNGQSAAFDHSNSASAQSTSHSSGSCAVTNQGGTRNTLSPTSPQ